MRVLIVTTVFPDSQNRIAEGSFVKFFARAIAKLVDEVNVVAPIPNSLGILPMDRYCRDYTEENIRVFFPRFPYFPIFRRALGDIAYHALKSTISRKGIEFDILHAHFSWYSGYAGVKIARDLGKPSVVTVHENEEWLRREISSGNRKIHWTWRNADAIIRISLGDVDALREFNKNTIYIPNGFDPEILHHDRDECRKKLGLEGKRVLFTLGNLIERKGFHVLLKALSAIAEDQPDLVCLIGGRGPMMERLKRMIRDLGLGNRVRLLGFIPRGELGCYYSAADLFVIPSLSEGTPIVLFEALGAGVPVVSTDVGGVRFVLKENVGLLARPGDSEDLATRILEALDRDWDRDKIRSYGSSFTWDSVAEKVLQLYKKLLGGGHGD